MSAKRGEIYKDTRFEALITVLSDNKRIEPKFDLSNGYTYPALDKIILENTEKNRDQFLMKMVSARILDKELFDIELRCPKCKSPDLSTRYSCPFCQSMAIVKNLLVEHVNCGQISTKSGFREENLFDTCPNCSQKYSEGGIKIVGQWFECSNCSKQIKNPMITHFCRNCRNLFSFDQAVQRDVYSYSLCSEAKKEIELRILFPSEIRKILTNANYTIEASNTIKGKSGIEYKFDYLSSNDKKTIAVDTLISSDPVSEIEIIVEQNKFYDTGIEIFVIATPKLNEQAATIAKASKLKIIEASNKKDALKGLWKSLIQDRDPSIDRSQQKNPISEQNLQITAIPSTNVQEKRSTHSKSCTHHFGYLCESCKAEGIPEDCLTCNSTVECMLSKERTDAAKEIQKWY